MTKTSTCCDAGRLPEGDDDLIDFHTHILPRIDDGSGSSQESLELLALEKEQGVDRIVFTPHFYAGKDSVENFLNHINACCSEGKRRASSLQYFTRVLRCIISQAWAKQRWFRSFVSKERIFSY